MADLTYRADFFGGYESTFCLFWERYSGRPWGYVYDSYGDVSFGNQPFGVLGQSSVYLPYIPTGADDPAVVYEDGFSYEQFAEYLERSGLGQYAGGYAPRNTERAPWTTNLDFKYTQELPGFVDGTPYNNRAFDLVTTAPTRYLPERSTWQAKIGIRYRF